MTGTFNIRVVQPRLMSEKDAAGYVGLPARRFPVTCPVAPIAMPGGVKLYDIRDLDKWVDAVKAGSADPDDAILSLLDRSASQ